MRTTATDSSGWSGPNRVGRRTIREVLADEDHVTELADDLEHHAMTIADALAQFERRRMQHDLRVLRQALERDLIDAFDFAR